MLLKSYRPRGTVRAHLWLLSRYCAFAHSLFLNFRNSFIFIFWQVLRTGRAARMSGSSTTSRLTLSGSFNTTAETILLYLTKRLTMLLAVLEVNTLYSKIKATFSPLQTWLIYCLTCGGNSNKGRRQDQYDA